MDEQGTTERWGGDVLNLGGVGDGTSLWLARAHSLAKHAPGTSIMVWVVHNIIWQCILFFLFV